MSQTKLEYNQFEVRPGEYSWEVMEHSNNVGEKPIRLVISPESIRTLTSLLLKKPKEVKEYWNVPSSSILKVSWCLELCVFSVLYSKQDDPKEYTKAFFVNENIGKKMVKRYKKIKPVHVHLSPGRPKKIKKKGYHVESHKPQNTVLLKSSFTLNVSEQDEKMWRATLLDSAGDVREIYLGISPSAVRVVNPQSLGAEWHVDHLHLLGIKYQTRFPNNNILTLKYFAENVGKHPKSKHFHVLPVTAKEILSYYDQCNIHSLGAEAKCTFNPLPFASLPELVHPSSLNGTTTDELISIPRSHSVQETIPEPSKIINQSNKLTTGTTGIPGLVGGQNGDINEGHKLFRKARPNSVKLPFRPLTELKDDPPRASSAKRARPKSTSVGLPPLSLEDGGSNENRAPIHIDIMSTRQSKREGGLSAASAPPQHRQTLHDHEPNLPQDSRGGNVKKHSRQKSVHIGAIPIRDNVCYYGKEGGAIKRIVKEVWEGPRVAYE